MSAVSLGADDLALLAQLTPDLDFSDTERQAALLENGSRDFNAVPGSGKTSLLAAKLLLLARKWPHATKGICVLSHTNVARDEIVRRLAGTDAGARLLTYPHFVGTIHAFVNQFLAMPVLRSLNLPVDMIDDEVFATRARARLQAGPYYNLRGWLNRQPNGDSIVANLFYKGAELTLASKGIIPGPTSDSGKQLADIKLRLSQRGIFRHRDMFAFALAGLQTHPELLDVIHRRFPMLFVDEMQDTSWEQEEVLNQLFDGKAVMQRYGDIDQKIILDDDDADKLTFPRAGHGTVSSSKRFGPRIAAAVSCVRMSKLPVRGEGPDGTPPVLLLYKTADVGRVVRQFGKMVIERFDGEALRDHAVRAMCTRKSVDGAVEAGRHLLDYWPPYALHMNKAVVTDGGFWGLIDQRGGHSTVPTLADRTADVRRALLHVLRAAKAPIAADLRDARGLPRAVAAQLGTAAEFHALTRDLALEVALIGTPAARQALPGRLFQWLRALLPDDLTVQSFIALDVFAQPPTPTPAQEPPTLCTVVHQERELAFSLGTVAIMKGETHLASLVLESYGGKSQRFDVPMALPAIAGVGKPGKLGVTHKVQMRNLYVAMSRPTRFLCLAANASRVDDATRAGLTAQGWQIETLG
jgi:hypothetical protein